MADFGGADAFAEEVRKELAAMYPPELKDPNAKTDYEAVWGGRAFAGSSDPQIVWMKRMAQKGWTAPTWPKEYGGGGLTPAEARVLDRELAAGKYRQPLASFGVWMLGPVLLEYATEEQKKEHLPKIIGGEIRWCQGYSEPGAGSDLAGLQTRCEDKGDHYLINGQKVWTSYANEADWIFCLVRTDTKVKHEGISFILFDMASPGVETRPIKLISGSSPFCETFFTDVKVPKENLVGKLNGGWEIAKRLLMYERQNISSSGFGGGGGALPVEEIAKHYVGVENDKLANGDLRARIAAHKMYDRAFGLTVKRVQDMAKAGEAVGHLASVFKVGAATLNQEKTELVLEALGNRALGWSGDGFSKPEIAATRAWLRAKGNSIEGGTTEVNLNVVAKRVLGLRDHQ